LRRAGSDPVVVGRVGVRPRPAPRTLTADAHPASRAADVVTCREVDTRERERERSTSIDPDERAGLHYGAGVSRIHDFSLYFVWFEIGGVGGVVKPILGGLNDPPYTYVHAFWFVCFLPLQITI